MRQAAGLVAKRVASRPVLALDGPPPALDGPPPALDGPEQEAVAGDVGADGGALDLINIGDIQVEGYGAWVSVPSLLALISRLEAQPRTAESSAVIVVLRDRLCAHLDFLRLCAAHRAAADAAREDLQAGASGPGAHTKDRRRLAERVAVTYQATARHVSKARVWREVAVVAELARLPRTRAVARQGLLATDKLDVITRQTSALPANRLTAPIEDGLIDAVIDVGARAGRANIARLLAPLRHVEDDARAAAVQAEPGGTPAVAPTSHPEAPASAGVWVDCLPGGFAQLRVVDQAENIAAVTTVIRAAARTLGRLGHPGTLGQLRAGVLADWARDVLRHGKVAGPLGASVPLDAHHGEPVRLRVAERPSSRIVPGLSAITVWELPGVGLLGPRQYQALRDGPEWEGIVQFETLISRTDPRYLAACGLIVRGHDPPAAMIRALRARDANRCRAPWCDRAEEPDDIHHVEPHSAGGLTSVDNLALLHADCHRVVHQGWRVAHLGAGVYSFTDRHGTTHITYPQGLRGGQ